MFNKRIESVCYIQQQVGWYYTHDEPKNAFNIISAASHLHTKATTNKILETFFILKGHRPSSPNFEFKKKNKTRVYHVSLYTIREMVLQKQHQLILEKKMLKYLYIKRSKNQMINKTKASVFDGYFCCSVILFLFRPFVFFLVLFWYIFQVVVVE